jgi:hypothetical protein
VSSHEFAIVASDKRRGMGLGSQFMGAILIDHLEFAWNTLGGRSAPFTAGRAPNLPLEQRWFIRRERRRVTIA